MFQSFFTLTEYQAIYSSYFETFHETKKLLFVVVQKQYSVRSKKMGCSSADASKRVKTGKLTVGTETQDKPNMENSYVKISKGREPALDIVTRPPDT